MILLTSFAEIPIPLSVPVDVAGSVEVLRQIEKLYAQGACEFHIGYLEHTRASLDDSARVYLPITFSGIAKVEVTEQWNNPSE